MSVTILVYFDDPFYAILVERRENGRLSLSKKLACGDLFCQELAEMFSAKPKTPRPPGKAGRYEPESEGLRPL